MTLPPADHSSRARAPGRRLRAGNGRILRAARGGHASGQRAEDRDARLHSLVQLSDLAEGDRDQGGIVAGREQS